MGPRALPLLLLLFALLAGCSTPGHVLEGVPTPTDPVAAKRQDAEAAALYAKAEELRSRERWEDARPLYRSVFEDYPGSPPAAEAQFLAADCAYRAGRLYAAGELLTKYREDRPFGAHVEDVEKELYGIGIRLIEEGRRGLWGLGIFTSPEEGVNVLRKLATLFPSGSYADDALMRIGRFYAAERDFPMAEMSLEELLKEHSQSEWRLQAHFLLGWVYREDNRGPEYDGEKLRRARAHYAAYLDKAASDPDRAAEYASGIAAAKEAVAAIDGDLARKALLRARLYRRMGRDDAALVVLREAARKWGDTEPGKECGLRAAALAGELGVPAEAAPDPPAGAPQ